MSECRTQRHLSDTFTDTTPAITAVFFVKAHVFAVGRASLGIGGNRYLGLRELVRGNLPSAGFSGGKRGRFLARAGAQNSVPYGFLRSNAVRF